MNKTIMTMSGTVTAADQASRMVVIVLVFPQMALVLWRRMTAIVLTDQISMNEMLEYNGVRSAMAIPTLISPTEDLVSISSASTKKLEGVHPPIL